MYRTICSEDIIIGEPIRMEIRMKYRLKLLRESELLSQAEVAKQIFVTQRTYSYYENEDHDIPTATLIRLADFYNVSVDYILGRTDNPKINR